jgi:eukaryotic-like serine/threonine-protein kinase
MQMQDTPLLNNRYQLEKSIGTGGMAIVYRARDLMLERNVAIKILREDFSADPTFRERFRQEAKAAANLYHPNIVTIHDFGLDSGKFFIVMENVPGKDLKSILQQRGRFKWEEAVSLMVQACAGTGYAHRAGLVHCDLKPHNMLVTPDMRLKVADFGIARALASIQPEEKANVVWGSPQYFSPEQASGAAPSPASDVYSLGVVLYEMLTGRLPFIANTASELAQMHREAQPTPPHNLNPEIPEALNQILLKVLRKEPSARYRTADQLGRVLLTITNPADLPGPTISFQDAPTTGSLPLSPDPLQPVPTSEPVAVRPKAKSETVEAYSKDENPLDIDWGTWILGLLALLAVGGLIPLWLWVYFTYNPPLP